MGQYTQARLQGTGIYGSIAGGVPRYLCKLNKKIPADSFVFINAWNEWGEGAMLEADTCEGYAYLEAVKSCVRQDDHRPEQRE
ncbi:MAG: glycoside hydrolase family 99-like domain-containing protein [Lachnospiraceae bacterium]|nr:glycoside hydrolase family 99-like domain-containing protein [Lachnospiraceae bacterium]